MNLDRHREKEETGLSKKNKRKIIDSRSRRLLFRRHANNSATSQRNRYEALHESINPAMHVTTSRAIVGNDRFLLARSSNERR